ncbi:MAG: hypothetical protein ACRCZB_04905 [Bacteroidales bacterium]
MDEERRDYIYQFLLDKASKRLSEELGKDAVYYKKRLIKRRKGKMKMKKKEEKTEGLEGNIYGVQLTESDYTKKIDKEFKDLFDDDDEYEIEEKLEMIAEELGFEFLSLLHCCEYRECLEDTDFVIGIGLEGLSLEELNKKVSENKENLDRLQKLFKTKLVFNSKMFID